MFLAGESSATPAEGLDALLPPWAQGISLVGLLMLIIAAWLRGWVVTKAQNERDVAAERRVSDIWEANALQSAQLNSELTQAFAPVLDGLGAIQRVVEGLQDEQRRMRDRGARE